MTASAVLGVFAALLLVCSFAGVPTVLPLLVGFALFFGYGVTSGCTWHAMMVAAVSGVRTTGKILITFLLVGILTATWRAGGTIPYIVEATSGICSGPVVLLATFLLCSLMSFLTGTSFGTAVTMGTICAFVASEAGVPIVLTGGAVLSGSYFGDRCSPVSTSALLVATLTRTTVAGNIPAMVRTSFVPFALSCAAFLALGVAFGGGGALEPVVTVASIASGFNLTPWMLLPAVLVLTLSLLRLDVWLVLGVGSVSATVIACAFQGMAPADVAFACIAGFTPMPGQSLLLAGGGVASMLNVAAIVLVSSTYAGMFEQTRMLDGVTRLVEDTSSRFGSFAAACLASFACALVCCNQSLTIMLSHQLCRGCEPDDKRLAVQLEDTAVVLPALVPWSIAAAVPLAAVGAPSTGVFAACFLYLVPLWNLLRSVRTHRSAHPGALSR